MTPAQADQVLVQPVDRPALLREGLRAGGERRPDGVVTTLPVLLDAAEALLVAVVHGSARRAS